MTIILLLSSSSALASQELIDAAEEGKTDEVVRLVQAGHKVNDADGRHRGWTPLMAASAKGHLETVRKLLILGADPKIIYPLVDSGDYTAITAADRFGHDHVVQEISNWMKHRKEKLMIHSLRNQPNTACKNNAKLLAVLSAVNSVEGVDATKFIKSLIDENGTDLCANLGEFLVHGDTVNNYFYHRHFADKDGSAKYVSQAPKKSMPALVPDEEAIAAHQDAFHGKAGSAQ
jgi:hypothetical protein